MKIINLKDDLFDADKRLVIKSIIEYNKKVSTGLSWKFRDSYFEKENRCQLLYGRNEGDVQYIIFTDEDWFWFKSKVQ